MIVDTEKVLREAEGPEDRDSTKKSALRRKGDRPWVRPGVRAREAGREPEDHKRFKIPKSECPDTWIRLP